MAEREDTKSEASDMRRHVFYLIGMLLLGLVTYSAAASVGLNLAMKRQAAAESESSAKSPSADSPAAQPQTSNRDGAD